MKYCVKILSICMLTILLYASMSYAAWNGISGTLPDPVGNTYTITTPEELAALADYVYEGENFKDKVIVLANDIDLGNQTWVPIGSKSHFSGTFDGQGHKITGLYVDRCGIDNEDFRALFGMVKHGTIKNLTVEGHVIGDGGDGYRTSAAIVVMSANNSHIENCHAYGKVEGKTGSVAAGICSTGYNSTFINCTNNAEISGSGPCWLGGIVADSGGSIIKECINNGRIKFLEHKDYHPAYYNAPAGGIVGYAKESQIQNSINNARIICNTTNYVGGIAGYFTDYSSKITNCVNNGEINGYNGVGGIVGLLSDGAQVAECENNNSHIKATYDPQIKACPHYDQPPNIYAGEIIGVDRNDETIRKTFKWDFH